MRSPGNHFQDPRFFKSVKNNFFKHGTLTQSDLVSSEQLFSCHELGGIIMIFLHRIIKKVKIMTLWDLSKKKG